VAVAEMYVCDVRVGDAEILKSLREMTARPIDESPQLRASANLIDQSQRLRRELGHLTGRHRDKNADALRPAGSPSCRSTRPYPDRYRSLDSSRWIARDN